MRSLLAELSATDLAVLAGLADEPLLSDDRFTEGSVAHCLEWIAGRRTWVDIAREAVARDDLPRGWEARARVLAAGGQLPTDLEERLQNEWRELYQRALNWKRVIASVPPPADAGSLFTEVMALQRESSQAAVPPDTIPSVPSDVRRIWLMCQRLEKFAGDAETLIQLISEQRSAQRRTVLQSARLAAESIFVRMEQVDSKANEHMLLTLLRALPELVREQDQSLLDRIRAMSSFNEEFVSEVADRCRVGAPPAQHLVTARAELPTTLSSIQLSAVSQTLVSSEPPALKGVSSLEELDAFAADARLVVDDLELGSKWMRLARATEVAGLQRLALGQSLTCFSRAYLDKSQGRLATELARDAVVALCLPDSWFRQDWFELAAVTLVATRVWARMNITSSPTGRPSQLASRADLMFGWMRDHDAVNVVAEIWAGLPDAADDLFFQVLLVHFAHGIELRHACVESALTAQRLRTRPLATMRRALRLLDEASKSDQLSVALHECASELEASSMPIGLGARQVLMRNADAIRRLLTTTASDPVAQSIGLRMSELLLRIASSEGLGGEAKLHLAPSVSVFYPAECSYDVWLPITVSNDRSAGPASELTVQLSLEGSPDKWTPELERSEFVIPPLNPGDAFTGHALLQLRKDAAQHHSAWQFRAALLRGADVVSSARFHVNVRERTSLRANPFSAGQAVQEDQFFVGREKQLRALLDALCADRRDITPLIVGLRRIGKTSLLKHVLRHREVARKYTTLFWDVQDLQNRCTTTHFLLQFATRVRAHLPESARANVRFHREEFREDPYSAFEAFYDDVTALELPQLILVGIDEFDHLVRLVRKAEERIQAGGAEGPNEAFQPQTMGALRKMLMKGASIRLVLCGLPNILSQATYEDRLFGLVQKVEVGPFQEGEADRVIEMAEPDVVFPARVRSLLYDSVGLQPYLLQLMCSSIYSRVSSSGRDEVTSEDLQEIIERDILPNETNFTDYLALIRQEDRPLVRALALAQKAVNARRRFVTPGEVVHELWQAGESRATVADVTLQLRAMSREERPLVHESGDHRGNFRLVIGLLTDRLVAR